MKRNLLYIYLVLLLTAPTTVFWGCKKYDIQDKGIYFTDIAGTGAVLKALTADDKGGSLNISASASRLVGSDVNIAFKVDTSLIDSYNKKNGTKYKPLPDRFFRLSATNAVIHAGSSNSDAVQIDVAPFDNTVIEGEQYMIPVKIADLTGDIPLLQASSVLYVAIARVIVNPALNLASTSNVTFAVPDPIVDLAEFTAEFRVRVTGTFRNNMALFYAYPSEIYSRFGDVVIQPNQLQVKYNGVQPASITGFASNKWYHIAYVFDGKANTFKIYVDGRLDVTTAAPANTRFNLSSMGFGGGGLPMQVQELRFWTRALPQKEIQDGQCAVNPSSQGLYGYWKFNEGAGNSVADITGHGHTGTFTGSNAWVPGIRCPEQ